MLCNCLSLMSLWVLSSVWICSPTVSKCAHWLLWRLYVSMCVCVRVSCEHLYVFFKCFVASTYIVEKCKLYRLFIYIYLCFCTYICQTHFPYFTVFIISNFLSRSVSFLVIYKSTATKREGWQTQLVTNSHSYFWSYHKAQTQNILKGW